jgi:hypothetical protein
MPELSIRCPEVPNRLFLKVIADGGTPHVTDGNLMELACSDCARTYRKSGQDVFRVLHRYAINAMLIETVVQFSDGTDTVISALD